jgi:hypothetical protein
LVKTGDAPIEKISAYISPQKPTLGENILQREGAQTGFLGAANIQ